MHAGTYAYRVLDATADMHWIESGSLSKTDLIPGDLEHLTGQTDLAGPRGLTDLIGLTDLTDLSLRHLSGRVQALNFGALLEGLLV